MAASREIQSGMNMPSSDKLISWAKRRAKSICSKKFLEARLPFLVWAKTYTFKHLIGDVIAGLSLALTAIPQGIGYAPIAGLPLHYGLYASLVPGFIYCLTGTTKEVNIGPTAVNSLMTFHYAGGSPYKAATLGFWTGIIKILAGVFNLGFLIQYVSAPVVSAFTTAVIFQVITSQVKGLVGLKFAGRGFVNIWVGVFEHIKEIRPADAILGFICLFILAFVRKLKEHSWCGKSSFAKTSVWLLSICSNLVLLVAGAVLAYILTINSMDWIILTGKVDQGLPAWQLPWQFNRNEDQGFNRTDTVASPVPAAMGNATGGVEVEQMEAGGGMGVEEMEGIWEITKSLGVGIVMVPLVSLLQHTAIVKFYSPSEKKVAVSQEYIAIGLCQLVGSFVGSMPVTAAFSRAGVNASSGVRTPFAGVITGLTVILACTVITPYFRFIPKATLSAVIIAALIFTVKFEIVKQLWRARKLDLVPYTLTLLLGILVTVETGLMVGAAVNLAILIFTTSKPIINVSTSSSIINVSTSSSIKTITPDRGLHFPSLEQIRTMLNGDDKFFIVDLSLVTDIDYTAATGLLKFIKQVHKKQQIVLLSGVNNKVDNVLRGLADEDLRIFENVKEAEEFAQKYESNKKDNFVEVEL